MFLNLDQHDKTKIAVKDDSGYALTYGEVCDIIKLCRFVIRLFGF